LRGEKGKTLSWLKSVFDRKMKKRTGAKILKN